MGAISVKKMPLTLTSPLFDFLYTSFYYSVACAHKIERKKKDKLDV